MRAAVAAALLAAAAARPLFSAYFANWARYHAAPYAYTVANLAPIAGRLDRILYSFLYFCPPPGTQPMPYWAVAPYGSCTDATAYELTSVEPSDAANFVAIGAMKAAHPNLRLLLSIGGWNFPSQYFSQMTATNASRATFIASVVSTIQSAGADGVDLDWEYPCSPPREDEVEISCTDFQYVLDRGGSCPDDTVNVVALLTELRAALGPTRLLTVASQAAKALEHKMAVSKLAPYVSSLNAMTYDFAVSDIVGAGPMSPNAPLYTPSANGTVQMSINYTVHDYLADKVPRSKIHIGIPLYAHAWYNTSLAAGNAWRSFGNAAVIQGECCGPFAATAGARPGPGSALCGTYMYSEVLAAAPTLVAHDNETQSTIAYFTEVGADGYTQPGTWMSYNDPASVAAIVDYALKQDLGGVFIFDTSMDTMEGGQFTYGIMTQIADALGT